METIGSNGERQFGCGALQVVDPDPRDYQWKNLGIGSRLTANTNKSEEIPFEVMDQRWSSACGGFAAAYYKFAIEWRQIKNKYRFSPYTTYGWRVAGSYEGEGMYTEDVNKALNKHGVPHFQMFDKGCYTYREAKELALKNKDKIADQSYKFRNQSYYACNNWTEVMQAIKVTGGCLIMIPIYPNYWTNTDGYIENQEGEYTGVNHFLCAIDYTDDFKYVKCINSWGDYNDLGGYLYLNTKNIDLLEASAWVDPYVEDELKAFSFPDVDTKRWSYDCVQICARNHIMDGFEDGTFRPDEPLTRAQAAKVFSLLLDLKPVKYKEGRFTDLDSKHWACQFIQACADEGFFNGFEDGTFRPDESMTREQMAVLASKAYKIKPVTYKGEFDDVSNDRWSAQYIQAVAKERLMVGVGDNKFSPESSVTREQMAALAYRMIFG